MNLVNYNWMEPFFSKAIVEAQFSPCVRRQYAAMVTHKSNFEVRHNARVTKACGKGGCVRNQQGILHGHHIRTELGAELHAEQAILIATTKEYWDHFILVGFDHNGEELLGENVYPCLVCARMIKYAGYRNVFMRNKDREILPVNIEDIISYQEEVLLENGS